jgi:hypothetical protein
MNTNTNTNTTVAPSVDAAAVVAPVVAEVAPVAPMINIEAAMAPSIEAPVAVEAVAEVAPTIASEPVATQAPVADNLDISANTETLAEDAVPPVAAEAAVKVSKEKVAKVYAVAPERPECSFDLLAFRDAITTSIVSQYSLSHGTAVNSFKNGKTDSLSDKTIETIAEQEGFVRVVQMIRKEDLTEKIAGLILAGNKDFTETVANAGAAEKAEKAAAKVIADAEKAKAKEEKAAAKVIADEDAPVAASVVSTPTAAPMIDIDALVAE